MPAPSSRVTAGPSGASVWRGRGWYGLEHVDTPRERIHIDLRVGGRYELTMVQRDSGAEFALGYDILELVEPELIVLRSDPMPEMGMPIRRRALSAWSRTWSGVRRRETSGSPPG
jgi:uncharacterized protein YndB with AHSA1/START domain